MYIYGKEYITSTRLTIILFQNTSTYNKGKKIRYIFNNNWFFEAKEMYVHNLQNALKLKLRGKKWAGISQWKSAEKKR